MEEDNSEPFYWSAVSTLNNDVKMIVAVDNIKQLYTFPACKNQDTMMEKQMVVKKYMIVIFSISYIVYALVN